MVQMASPLELNLKKILLTQVHEVDCCFHCGAFYYFFNHKCQFFIQRIERKIFRPKVILNCLNIAFKVLDLRVELSDGHQQLEGFKVVYVLVSKLHDKLKPQVNSKDPFWWKISPYNTLPRLNISLAIFEPLEPTINLFVKNEIHRV